MSSDYGIDRRFDGRPNPFYVVRMHPPNELLDIVLSWATSNISFNRVFHQTRRWSGSYCTTELGCVEGKLQTIFARLQGLLVPPALD